MRNIRIQSCVKALLIGLFLAVTVSGAFSEDWGTLRLEQPVLITPAGQSPDGLMVKVLLGRAGVKFSLDNQANKESLASHKSLILVVGYSGKGLGAAGISKEDEINRIKGLIAEAKVRKIPVILAHIGGQARRGPSTQELLDIIAPSANAIIYVEDGNKDGMFSGFAKKYAIPARSSEKISATGPLFEQLFK